MGKRKRSKAPVLPPPPPAATAPSKKRSRGGRGNAKKARPAGGGDSQDSPTAEGQALIAKYHTLNKYLESLDHQPNLTPEEKRQKREELHRQLEELGGLEVYQQSSLRGESCQHYKAFNSSLWVLPEIRSRRLYQKICGRSDGEVEGSSGAQEPAAAASGRKLRLLDVGAITNHYSKESNWLQVTAIDLHPQDPSVLQADLFEFAPNLLRSRLPAAATEQQEAEKEATGAKEESPEGGCFDVIVLSLVLNFVGDPRRRGEMLCHCANLLRAGTGHLFVVLPLPCLSNSRYLDHGLFLRLMEEGLGFTFAGNKKSNKLAFYIFRKLDGNAATTSQLRSLSSTQQQHISSDDEEEEEEEEEEESDEDGADIGKQRAGVTCSVRSNRYAKRKKCRFSTTNNNFCILLRCRHSSTSLS